MLPRETRRKADVVVSTLLAFFGAFIIYQGTLMPWVMTRTSGASQWFLSPGLFPVIVGGMLIAFSLRILATALAEGGGRGIGASLKGWLRGLPRNHGVMRVGFMILWIGLYVFAGVGNAEYRLVSAIFLFVFIAAFWLPGAGAQLPKRLMISALVSVLVPVCISYVFSTYLYVPAP